MKQKAGVVEKQLALKSVAKTKCPTCGAEPGSRCRNTKTDDTGRHRYVPTHRRRVTAYVIY